MKSIYKILFLACCLCGVAVLMSSCSGGKTSASSALTRSDAEKIAGQSMKIDKETTGERENSCIYVDKETGNTIYVEAAFRVYYSDEQAQSIVETMKTVDSQNSGSGNNEDERIENIEGIGDAAWLIEAGKISQTLYVQRKNVIFLLGVTGKSDDTAEERGQALKEMRRIAESVAAGI